jgi:hypothetical protein
MRGVIHPFEQPDVKDAGRIALARRHRIRCGASSTKDLNASTGILRAPLCPKTSNTVSNIL